ncbi:endonuclease [Lacinutrix neustonica]|uniref:Endonuclease n=1 Tax=Lacinutrix neustonica TaxID=2980107 RepID=A0A9E8MVZ5_9FLAO|nr:endonuclease [Lacinutrix neustonica]WAC02632.1 endonuclease [Lacinutrix neustonica]
MTPKSHSSLVTALLFTHLIFAQIPIDYYESAENLADDSLKFELNNIIDNHIEFSYTSTNTDVWDILKDTDRDPNNVNNVVLIYSGVSVDAAQEYNSGNGWTREHVWAKSRGDFGTTRGPGTDVHALRPLDNTTNSIRNNRSFNNCSNCQNVTDKWGNITGSQTDTVDWSFEPRDDVKGDVARMLFYMVVRYEGLDAYPDLEPTEWMLPNGNNEPVHGVWSTLMDWHRNDPVDAWEENRNDIIYYAYQHNRNPFIDYPELAEHLRGTAIGVDWPIDQVLSLTTFKDTYVTIYPNPASNIINITGLDSKTKLSIYDMTGRKVLQTRVDNDSNSINVSQLHGIYMIHMVSENQVISKRIIIN